MRKFTLEMSEVQIVEIETRAIKNANKEQIGERLLAHIGYMGGYVKVDVDKAYAEELKRGITGVCVISMEPNMDVKKVQNKAGQEFNFIDTGFTNFKLIGFTPNK